MTTGKSPGLPLAPHLPDLTRWDALQGEYEALLERDVSPANAEAWLQDWSQLSERVYEGASLLSIRRSQNTADEDRKAAYLAYLKNTYPKLQEAGNALQRKLVETGWSRADMDTTLRSFRTSMELFREENLPLLSEERALATQYSDIVGGLTVEFDGKELTLPQLAPYRSQPDRAVREGAWRAGAEKMLEVRDQLNGLFAELLELRQAIADNAGFDSYLDYRWRQLGRHDYGPEEAEAFHTAIREAGVPALERASQRRADALGLDVLRPWDVEVDPYGDTPLRPFDDAEELTDTAIAMFDRLDPELGGMLRTMRDDGLLDLANRKAKAPGGYCSSLAHRRRPFIFMNAVGTADNVRTLLHEAGHAFHVFERSEQPFIWQRSSPVEFAEVASMSMELLTSPYLEQSEGGYYADRDAIRSRLEHLDRMIRFLPYMATVSSFQHWLYPAGHPSSDEIDAAWQSIYLDYNVGVDWSGLEETLESLWHHKLHIFTVPLYYIEYGLAQMGALQVWRNSLEDPQAALEHYRQALSLGGTRKLPELFEAAGAALVFDTDDVAPLIDLVETHMNADLEALAGLED